MLAVLAVVLFAVALILDLLVPGVGTNVIRPLVIAGLAALAAHHAVGGPVIVRRG